MDWYNHRYSERLKQDVLELIRTSYIDFGPTFVSEKLLQHHQIKLSRETLRAWMIEADIWLPRAALRRRIHQPRSRRECFGEMIQLDGSPHAWFEGRSDPCTLLVFIDDATSRIQHLYFCEAESTFSYMMATKQYLAKHGKPVFFHLRICM